MILQRIILKLLSSGVLSTLGERLLYQRAWRVQSGEGAGLKFKVSHNLDYITGKNEVPVQKALRQWLHPGDAFYDVGANIGFLSMIAARLVGAEGRVYSFEPVPENSANVRGNATLNGFGHVEVFDVAVGNASGKAELFLAKWLGGASLSGSAVPSKDAAGSTPVKVVALDDFITHHKLRPPSFVKVDVEGAEWEAFRGMERTIAEARPTLLYEIDDGDVEAFRRRRQEMDDYVTGLGYCVQHLEASYTSIRWNVGHSLALPREGASRS